MKKTTRLILLLGVLTALLCVSALAAGEPTTAGIYNAGKAQNISNVTVTPATGTPAAAKIDNTDVDDFYSGAEKVTVSYSGATEGKYYLLIVTNKKTTAPQTGDIVYIDQVTAGSSGVTFTAYPSALGKGTYYVYLSSNADSGYGSGGLTEIGSFKHYVPYILGDADGDKVVTSSDAAAILRHVAKLSTLSGSNLDAAKVYDGQTVTSSDAATILRKVAKLIDKFPVEN